MNRKAISHILVGASFGFTCFSLALLHKRGVDGGRISEIRRAIDSGSLHLQIERSHRDVIEKNLRELEFPSLYGNWFIGYNGFLNSAMVIVAVFIIRQKEPGA